VILRRVVQHVKDQNWFAVGIDFVIVVLGVFIGLQVNNWNEARADRQLGAEYTVRLIADLEQDLYAARTLASYYDDVTEAIKDADRLLSQADPDPMALLVAAYRASEYNAGPASRATWDQIVSSGHLALLADAALESGLSDYYRFTGSVEETIARLQDTPYRRAVRALIPLTVQLAIREGCSDVRDSRQIIVGFVTDCHLGLDSALINETAQALMGSADIREWLRYQYSMVGTVQGNNYANVLSLEQLLATLTDKQVDE